MRHAAPLVLLSLLLFGCDGTSLEPSTEAPTEEPAAGGEEAPADDIPPPSTRRTSPDGMCGGIAGFECPERQWCDMDGDYPDASGTCRPEGECDTAADCDSQQLVHAMCVGAWACADGRCSWECS